MISGNVTSTFNPSHHPSLGNNLFLIATTLGIAWDNNTTASFPTLKFQCEYWKRNHENTVYRNVLMDDIYVSNTHTSKTGEDCFLHEKITYEKNLELSGYYLCHKYFDNYREKIINIFCVDDITKKYIYDKYPIIDQKNVVSVHVRRGDYKKTTAKTNGGTYRLDQSYYINAINLINNKIGDPTYIIFTEKEDDSHWCKKYIKNHFRKNNIVIIVGEIDYVDMYMMSLCRHNIIANSTFSWWGAYLNTNKDKIVVYPKGWLDESRELNFFLPDWIGCNM